MEDHKKKKNNKHQDPSPEGNAGEELIQDERKWRTERKRKLRN